MDSGKYLAYSIDAGEVRVPVSYEKKRCVHWHDSRACSWSNGERAMHIDKAINCDGLDYTCEVFKLEEDDDRN